MAQTKDASNDKKNKDSLKIGAQGPNKIVIRRLPPTLSSEVFLQQVSPLPEFSYYYFVSGELSDCPFSRAYFYFVRNEDVMIFQEKFDGYVFLDEKGNEYPAVVEYAPYNKVPKAKVKIDPKAGTIEYDPDYLKFLDALEKCDQENVPTPESLLEDIEAKEKLVKCSPGFLKMSTPLIDFLNKRREDKRQAQLMKAKQKEEERRKRQALKEQNKAKTKEKCQDDADQDPVKEHDQEKAKVLSKSSKGATSKTQISEDLKLRDWVSDREHFQKSKYEPQKKREEIFKKGKSKYSSFPKDKRDEYDTKPKIEKHVPKNGESESNSGKWSSLESNSVHSKDSRQEPASEALQKKNKMAVEIQDYKKDENYKAVDRRETESKQRIRYKDRPERPIYRPGHKKEKQEEQCE